MSVIDDARPAWRDAAECNTGDARLLPLFFPEQGKARGWRDARALCDACPVSAECLAHIMEVEQPGARYGFAAGLTAEQRDDLGDRRPAR